MVFQEIKITCDCWIDITSVLPTEFYYQNGFQQLQHVISLTEYWLEQKIGLTTRMYTHLHALIQVPPTNIN